jgi:hypothetical protein
MPWNITFHTECPLNAKIGDMWPVLPDWFDSDSLVLLSQRYNSGENGKRHPLMVMLPSIYNKDGERFLVDRYASGDANKTGWKVILIGELVDGQKPDITMEPSINCVGSYHGYIRNGVITDDCEGRTYPEVEDPER